MHSLVSILNHNIKTRKGVLRKNIVAYFSDLVYMYMHSHFLNTKQLHYLNSLKHGNMQIYSVMCQMSLHTEFSKFCA